MPDTRYELIGEDFYSDLIMRLKNHEHVALLGPRNCGKAMVIEEIESRVGELLEVGRPRFLHLVWSDFRGLTQDQSAGRIRRLLKIGALESSSPTATLSGRIVDMLRLAVEADRSPLWIFVSDVLGFPKSVARQLLNALYEVNYDDFLRDRIAAVVTGSADFIPLTYGPDSPFNHASRVVVTGFDEEYARRYFRECRARQRGQKALRGIDEEIDEDAFNYLYEQTGGNPHFIQELIGTAAHYASDLEQRRPSEVWKLEETKRWIDSYKKTFMHGSYIPRMMIREVENLPESFDLVLQVMRGHGGEIVIPPENRPHQLEVCGLLACDEKGVARFASPMIESFVRAALTDRYIADVYVLQGRWEEAWSKYETLPPDLRDRPVSGDARFRLDEALTNWQACLLDKAHEGIDAVVEHFLKGMRHLHGFDSGGLYAKDAMKWVARFGKTAKSPVPPPGEIPRKRIKDQAYWLDSRRLKLWSDPGVESLLPGRPRPALLLQRSKPGYEIDFSDQQSLRRDLAQFWRAYESAQEIEYRRTIGDLREKHLRIIEAANSQLAEEPFDMGNVVRKTAEELVHTGGYYRVLICLVDPKREKIQGVASSCKDASKDFSNASAFHTNFDVPKRSCSKEDQALWDIQQWVVAKNRTVQEEDVRREGKRDYSLQIDEAKALGMKAITVVPMTVGDEVIGTISFERADKEAPNDDEVELFEILARQLAAVFRQAQRMTLLEGAIKSVDDYLSLVDPRGNVLFLNPTAAREIRKTEGWQVGRPKSKALACLDAEESRLMEQARETGSVFQYYRTSSIDDKPRASALQMARIDDFRSGLGPPFEAEGLIGYLKLVHDLTPLYEILAESTSWFEAHGLQETAQRILDTYKTKGYEWCRIYMVENADGEQMLKSYAQFGLQNKENIDRFESGGIVFSEHNSDPQPWHILKSRIKEPVIYKYSSDQPQEQVKDTTNPMGLPESIVGNIQFEDELEITDKQWIEAPLFVGDTPLGKVCLSLPKGLEPRHSQLLKLSIQNAALALEHAGLDELEEEFKTAAHTAEMATRIFHGLRSLLAACGVYAQTHQDLAERNELSPKDSKSIMDAILGVLARTERISDDYMTHIRGYAPIIAPVDVVKELREICSLVADARSEIEVAFSSPVKTMKVETDAGALASIVDELIHNAAKAGASRVSVVVKPSGREKFRIIVEDNGPGVPEWVLPVLFKADLKKSSTGGTGLGLAIVHDTVEALGGIVELYPHEPGAKRFIITLPRTARVEERTAENGYVVDSGRRG